MFIAFEGPDNTGKSTSAARLSYDGHAIYNATKTGHAYQQRLLANEPEVVQCYDRIDWLTHMVYRLAMPDRDWNDERPRTVFAMPDTHLVFKIHDKGTAGGISDELYVSGQVALANDMYWSYAAYLSRLNEVRDFQLFRTISIIRVRHDQLKAGFQQELVAFSSPVTMPWEWEGSAQDDKSLLNLLRYDDHHRL